MISLNLGNTLTYFAPTGYPLKLWKGGDTLAIGILPKEYQYVAVDAYADIGADITIGYYYMPNVSDGDDGYLVQTVDTNGNTTYYQTTYTLNNSVSSIAVKVPVANNITLTPYVFKISVNNIQGFSSDPNIRQSGATNPLIPNKAYISRVYIPTDDELATGNIIGI